jgi:hypothetical protein
MTNLLVSWQFWAFLAAIFAALTAVFVKLGVQTINSDLATFLRTLVVAVALGGLVWATGKFERFRASMGGRGCSLFCRVWRPARPGCAISGRCSWATPRAWRPSTS